MNLWKTGAVLLATMILGCMSPSDPTLDIHYRYFVTLPKDYEQKDMCPMILFLHGAGCGTSSVQEYEAWGLGDYAKLHDDFPFVVVAPQTLDGWEYPLLLDEVFTQVQSDYRIDPDRIYVTGFSMGGYGSYMIAFAYPYRFAALAPICGWGDTTKAASIRHLPVWIFHDSGDPEIPFSKAQEMYDALTAQGANVQMTVYNNNTHDAWSETYAKPELYAWFLGFTLTPEPGSEAQGKTSEYGE
jgi:predicted peptidase